jgi:hypothetical protein
VVQQVDVQRFLVWSVLGEEHNQARIHAKLGFQHRSEQVNTAPGAGLLQRHQGANTTVPARFVAMQLRGGRDGRDAHQNNQPNDMSAPMAPSAPPTNTPTVTHTGVVDEALRKIQRGCFNLRQCAVKLTSVPDFTHWPAPGCSVLLGGMANRKSPLNKVALQTPQKPARQAS